jgi:hypothetical protein
MEVIVGVGDSGCKVADRLRKEENYETYKINSSIRGNRALSLGKKNTIQEYEAAALDRKDKINDLLEDISEDDLVTVVLSGADILSGAALIILETLRDKSDNLDVMYIRPDRNFLSKDKKENDAFVGGVLQEFARSGSIEKIYLIDVAKVETVMGEVPLAEYDNRLHDLIASTATLVKFYNSSPAILDNRGTVKETSRIATFGVSSFEDSVPEQMFFNLKAPTEKIYYYGMSKKDLESDGSLLKKIKAHAKSMENKKEAYGISFAVFQTSYEENMVLCCIFSDKVQV